MSEKIAVIGLGYVGLPLAVALSRQHNVFGFDISLSRVKELKLGFDRTGEVEDSVLKSSNIELSSDINELMDCNIYIITVPTPVDKNNKPDLTAVKAATNSVAACLKKGDIIVYESTVYPGVTEDICGPILEQKSGLKSGIDFFLGYSPERINPGDKKHTIDKITKVVSAQTPEIASHLAKIYGSINNGNIYIARNIKTAEAAKVIENAQRDINIAFMNEVSLIFDRLGISTYDVLAAANTKWNFLPFTPGLVGGHCIGVDPYYLAECAKDNGYNPEVILSGRRINDAMGGYLAKNIHERLSCLGTNNKPARILILGLTFKENVPDLRNTKVIDIVKELENYGHDVSVHDVMADQQEAMDLYQVNVETSLDVILHGEKLRGLVVAGTVVTLPSQFDCIVGLVSHKPYMELTKTDFESLVRPGGLVVDIKNMWGIESIPQNINYWKL